MASLKNKKNPRSSAKSAAEKNTNKQKAKSLAHTAVKKNKSKRKAIKEDRLSSLKGTSRIRVKKRTAAVVRKKSQPAIKTEEDYAHYDMPFYNYPSAFMNPSKYGEHHSENYPYYSESIGDAYPEYSGIHSESPMITLTKNRRKRNRGENASPYSHVRRRRTEAKRVYRNRKRAVFPGRGKENYRRPLPHEKLEAGPQVEKRYGALLPADRTEHENYAIRLGNNYYSAGLENEDFFPRPSTRNFRFRRGTDNYPETFVNEYIYGGPEEDYYESRERELYAPKTKRRKSKTTRRS